MSVKLDFQKFKLAVQVQFARLVKLGMFRVALDKGALYARYQEAWPEGTNEIYKTRREHDCTCCHAFIRSVGNCVAINEDGEIETIWDLKVDEPTYQIVADSMADFVSHHPIEHVFLSEEKTAGTDHSKWMDGEEVKRWDHFFVNIPKEFVKHRDTIGPELNRTRGDYDVLKRGLEELSLSSLDIVLELIAQNSLYNAKQKENTIQAFKKLLLTYQAIPASQPTARSHFVWTTISKPETYVGLARLRNSSIGTLLVDLSEGKELEDAVRSYEKVVAPENYKRPKSLVTEGMVRAARDKVAELGLTSALSRRYATIDDISVNNVLFINRELRNPVAGAVSDPFSSVPTKAKTPTYDKAETISIDTLFNLLPTCTLIEALVENRHTSNLVSLIAPADPTSEKLFKWDNGFSWSYNGALADSSLRKEVAARGGRVDGAFRFSHSWNHPGRRNCSLMDLHVFMPGSLVPVESSTNDAYGNAERVGWNNRKHSRSGGVQDVDYTSRAPEGYVPVENITFPNIDKMPEGRYICKVHNWSLRSPTEAGFQAEIEVGGVVYQYDYPMKMADKEWVTVAEVHLKKGEFTVKHHLKESASSNNVWGLDTQKFHKVSSIMRSPNFWDGEFKSGNMHTMFMLEGCANPEEGRGFYNEFLRGELEQHRKVFEMLGSNFKAPKSDRQLSGLGFSSTQRNSVVLRLTGALTRIVKVEF